MLWADFNSIDHERFMRAAIAEAELALAAGDLPIGSVIVCDGLVLARGRNRIRANCSQLAHAEVTALRNGGELLFRRFEDCIIYSTREPCVMCLGAIAMADVRHIVFGAADHGRGGPICLRMCRTSALRSKAISAGYSPEIARPYSTGGRGEAVDRSRLRLLLSLQGFPNSTR
jgi:tRNA(adenine34) deaminase